MNQNNTIAVAMGALVLPTDGPQSPLFFVVSGLSVRTGMTNFATCVLYVLNVPPRREETVVVARASG